MPGGSRARSQSHLYPTKICASLRPSEFYAVPCVVLSEPELMSPQHVDGPIPRCLFSVAMNPRCQHPHHRVLKPQRFVRWLENNWHLVEERREASLLDFQNLVQKRGLNRPAGGRSASGAGDGIRTRDINLGKVALYQLSYSRARSQYNRHSPTTLLRSQFM
jgi:hypothetical protein